MSKRAKKCPDCGAIVPASATMCNKCGYKPPVSDPEHMDSLPRPVRPEAPRPVETSRWPEQTSSYEEAAAERRGPSKNIWQLAAVLALIVVIIVIAVVLVIKMNAPANDDNANPTQQSQTFNESNNGTIVIDPNSQSTAAPVADDVTDPEPTAEPEATPEAEEEEDPEPTAEPTPVPTEAPEEKDFVVSEMNDTVYITGSTVNLREGPGTDYDVVTTQAKGTQLKRTGVTDNGWSQVEYDGEECYISSTYVSNNKPPVEVSEKSDTVVVTTTANIRKGPGTEHDVVVVANANVELKRTGVTDNGWSRVEYEGQEVYIFNDLIKEKEDDSSETTQVTEKTVTVNTASNIRKGPGTDYDVIATVPAGTKLTATGITDTDWYQVKYNDQTAYIAGNLVTE